MAVTEICSIQDAAAIVDELIDGDGDVQHWFRGQCDSGFHLLPYLYRNDFYDEYQTTSEFKLNASFFINKKDLSQFEWICTLQHYGGPTRLLDWSENMMVALFFAACSLPARDGALFILDPFELSRRGSIFKEGHVAWQDSIDVVIRSMMSEHDNINTLLDNVNEFVERNSCGKMQITIKNVLNDRENLLKKIAYPISVVPRRDNDRLLAQRGTFTIFGGKRYHDTKHKTKATDIPKFIEIGSNADDEYVTKYIIPASCKDKILNQLHAMGIDRARIFPDLGSQAASVSERLKNRFFG